MVIDRKPHLVTTLLVTAHLAVPLVTFAFSTWRPDDWAARNVFRVVIFSEAGLLGIWAAIGSANWQRRAAITSLGWLLCWVLLASRHPKYSVYWLGVYLLLPSFASLLLAMAVQWSQQRRAERAGDQTANRWQFTTNDLLLFTTAVGVSIVFAQRFLASTLSIEPLFVLCEASQLSLLIALASAAGAPQEGVKAGGAAIALGRFLFAALAATGLGLIAQSYLSASYFWDALRNLLHGYAGGLWEDLFSIPAAVVFESLFALATIRLWRSGTAVGCAKRNESHHCT